MTIFYTVSFKESTKRVDFWEREETEIIPINAREDGTAHTQVELESAFKEILEKRDIASKDFTRRIDLASITWESSPLQDYTVNIDFTSEPSRGSYEVDVKAVSEEHANEIAENLFEGECVSDHIEEWNDEIIEDMRVYSSLKTERDKEKEELEEGFKEYEKEQAARV